MNMKRINEVPVIEELGEKSYVLVDNDGAAARIAGSKVGGGGGGELPMLYVEFFKYIGNDALMEVYTDPSGETKADYETGVSTLSKALALALSGFDSGAMISVLMFFQNPDAKVIDIYVFEPESEALFKHKTLIFSDSVIVEE